MRVPGDIARVPGAVPRMQGGVKGEGATMWRVMRGCRGTCASGRGSASDAGGCYGQRCDHAEGDARVAGGALRDRTGHDL